MLLDQQNAGTAFVGQASQDREQTRCKIRSEAGGELVDDKQLRPPRHRTCQRDLLPLTPGELAAGPVEQGTQCREAVQRPLYLVAGPSADREAQNLADGQPPQRRPSLRCHGQSAAGKPGRVRAAGQVAEHAHPTAERRELPGRRSDQGCLAGAVGPEQRDELTGADLEGDLVHHGQPVVPARDLLQGQHAVPARLPGHPRGHRRRATEIHLADLGSVPDRGRRTGRDDPPAIEHHDVVARLENQFDVMIDKQDRVAVLGQTPQPRGERGPRRRVQARRRLIHEQHPATRGQRPAEPDSEALIVRQTPGKLVDERPEFQRLGRLGAGDGEVLGDGQILEQFQGLEGTGEAAAEPLMRRHRIQHRPVQHDLTGAGRREAGERIDQGGLPGAVRPDQPGDPPRGQSERHVMDDFDLAIGDTQSTDVQADAAGLASHARASAGTRMRAAGWRGS